MYPRKALKNLDANALVKGRGGLPRIRGSSSMRSKKFASTSKTPRISNRADAPTPSSTGPSFVTTRKRAAPRLDDMSPFRLVDALEEQEPAPQIHGAPRTRDPSQDSPGRPPAFREKAMASLPKPRQSKHSDEDMDLDSDSDEIMSPDEVATTSAKPSHKNSYRTSTQASDVKPIQEDVPLSSKGQKESFQSFLSQPIATPPGPIEEETDPRQPATPPSQQGDALGYLEDAKRAPTDDPVVLSKIMQSGKYAGNLLGSEIGGDQLHQESLDGSEITQSTITDISKRPSRQPVAMPTFEPRETLITGPRHTQARKSQESEVSEDMVEEYSLPDEQVNKETTIVINGKEYIHRKLDPGWVVKVSKTRNKPYYIHPDFGTTWQCPNSLPPKSKARKFKRSRGEKNEDGIHPLKTSRPQVPEAKPTIASPPKPSQKPNEDIGTMSELIKGWQSQPSRPTPMQPPTDGYDGSISSHQSSDSVKDEESSKKVASTVSASNGEKYSTQREPEAKANERLGKNEDLSEWITPMRDGIATPKSKKRRKSAKTMKIPSSPHLSPIEENDMASPRQISMQKAHSFSTKGDDDSIIAIARHNAASKKPTPVHRQELASDEVSTPRVSFDPIEICHSLPGTGRLQKADRPTTHSAKHSGAPANSRIRAALETSTPILDIDEAEDKHKDSNLSLQEVVVGSTHHSSSRKSRLRDTPLYTPQDYTNVGPSEPRDAPQKRKSFSSLPRQLPQVSHVNEGDSSSHLDPERRESFGPQPNPSVGVEPEIHSDEWSPFRKEEERVAAVTNEETCARSLANSPESVGFPIVDDSESLSSESKSPCEHITEAFRSPVDVPRATPPPTSVEHSMGKLVESPLSISPAGSIPEQFDAHHAEDFESDILSPPKLRRTPKRFNWRVTHPLFPICALQRIDELLREQRQRQRKSRKQVSRKRKQAVKKSSKHASRLRKKSIQTRKGFQSRS